MFHMSGQLPDAYSRLGLILARENLSVLALRRKLEAAGVPVNVKSLYRLAEDAPIQKIDLRIAAAICQAFGIALGELISFEKPKAQLRRLDGKAQARLDALMSKNNEGQLTVTERKEFVALAGEAHRISMENARTLLAEGRRAGKQIVRRKKSVPSKRVETVA
jgi:DNA-binding Xre family transcriptional regulator